MMQMKKILFAAAATMLTAGAALAQAVCRRHHRTLPARHRRL
jgi:hypothetical protein